MDTNIGILIRVRGRKFFKKLLAGEWGTVIRDAKWAEVQDKVSSLFLAMKKHKCDQNGVCQTDFENKPVWNFSTSWILHSLKKSNVHMTSFAYEARIWKFVSVSFPNVPVPIVDWTRGRCGRNGPPIFSFYADLVVAPDNSEKRGNE